jgi:hypothetical protein
MSFSDLCLRRGPRIWRPQYLGLALVLAAAGVAAQEPTFMVLNPTGDPPPLELKSMTERPESLDGKTIFFVDQTFNNADVLLEEMMKWFNMHMPEVKTEYRRKTGGYTTDDPALWREIQAADGLMIMAIGH